MPSHPLPDIEIRLKRLPHGEGLPAPAYTTDGAAGMDVVAAEELTLAPGQRHAVATGFAVAIPHGYEIQVRPRSGLALKHGISVPNRSEEHTSELQSLLRISYAVFCLTNKKTSSPYTSQTTAKTKHHTCLDVR